MKKFLLFTLSFLLILSLLSCKENSDNTPGTSENTADTENVAPVETENSPADITETEAESEKAPEDTTEPATEAPVTEPAETEPADDSLFDTSWASNEFEALLPELPFTGWTTEKEGDNIYKMELGGLDDGVITDADGNTVGYGKDKEALISYLDSLSDYDFSVEETGGIEGYQYKWLVYDPEGNEIEFTCAEGYCWIEIYKLSVSEDAGNVNDTASFNTSWAGTDYPMPIPEPPFSYEVNIRDNGVMITSLNGGENGDVYHDDILDYCGKLKDAGFTEIEREGEIGVRYGRICYEFAAENSKGQHVELVDDGGGVVIYLTLN